MSEKGGFGVMMTPEQFEVLQSKMNFLTDETARREEAVNNSLSELKKIESVRTYASFVKDITTSIQTLSTIPNTEKVREELLESLNKLSATFVPYKENTLESKTIQVLADTRAKEPNEQTLLQNECVTERQDKKNE